MLVAAAENNHWMAYLGLSLLAIMVILRIYGVLFGTHHHKCKDAKKLTFIEEARRRYGKERNV